MKYPPLLALCLGFFMVIIDATIVNVALPSLAQDLGVSMTDLQWIVAGYTLTFACLLLAAGHLGDRLGAKNIFLCGLILFVFTSLGCALSTHFIELIIFRITQGIAAAFLVPTSLALINATYKNKEQRVKAIGLWASIGGIAAASGPILGAILTTWFSWRAVFFVNIPIGIIGIFLTTQFIINPNKNNKTAFDFKGQILSIISIAALAISLIEAGRLGWFSFTVISGFIIFIITFIIFLMIEQRAAAPMFPLYFFKSNTFSASIIVGMLLNIGFYGELFILPLYFQQLRHYSVLMAGLAILPQTGLVAVASFLSGKLINMAGARLPILLGLIIGALGFFTLLITDVHTPSYLLLILPLAAIGFGTAFTMPAATSAVIHSTPAECAGIAAGALNASRQIGSLIGVAVFGTIITTAHHFIMGMHYTLIMSGILFIMGGIIAANWIKEK